MTLRIVEALTRPIETCRYAVQELISKRLSGGLFLGSKLEYWMPVAEELSLGQALDIVANGGSRWKEIK